MKICQGEGGRKGCIAPVTHWCFAGEGQGRGLLATAAPEAASDARLGPTGKTGPLSPKREVQQKQAKALLHF